MDEPIQEPVENDAAPATPPTGEPSQQTPSSPANPPAEPDSKAGTGTANEGLTGGDEDSNSGNAPKGVPEGGYTFDGLQVGEGLEIDQPTAEAFAKIAEEVGLSQDAFNTVYNKLMPYLNQRQDEQLQELRGKFLEEARNDQEIGGAKYQENMALARKAFKQFVDPETQELLQASGLDCHPGLIRAFVNVGRAISNDAVVRGHAPSQRDPAKAFFNNSDMN